MKVARLGKLCRGFAKPPAILIHTRVDSYKVNPRKIHWIAVFVDSPPYVETVQVLIVIRVVVDITTRICIEDIVASCAAGVHPVGRKKRALECQFVFTHPLRIIFLTVENVFSYIARATERIMPWDVGHICQIAALVLNRRMAVALPAIGYLITMKCFRLVILASGKLIPLIVRDAVAVCIETDHNDARLSDPPLLSGLDNS